MTRPINFKLWLFLVLALLVALAIALWLTLRHQDPTFTIVDFAVPTSNNSNPNWVDKHHHGPDILFTLVIKNPSKIYSITYDNIFVTVKYNQGALGQTNFPGFKQGKDKKDRETGHLEADEQLLQSLLRAISAKPILKVELNTRIRYKVLGHHSKRHDQRLQGQFSVGPDGKITGKKKKVKLCKVGKKSC